jgi:hypothetical protein
MSLFDENEFLTKEEKAKKEYKESYSFLVSILIFVCKTPFKLFGVVISIIYRAIFNNSKMSVQDMNPDQKFIAAREFKTHGETLKKHGEKSLTEQEIIQITKKEYGE